MTKQELKQLIKEELKIALKESKIDYQIYHGSYSSAIQTAIEYAKKRGYDVDEDDIWNRISVGPAKPQDGKTNRFSISLIKDGKEQKKTLNIQIYGMGNKYELNCYIS
jgi:hypothetical protein